MGQLLVEEKNIVVPGEEIANGMDFLPSTGTFRDGDSIVASKLGILSVNNKVTKVIALKGIYEPQRGDMVIGTVTDVGFSGWSVDIGAFIKANLPVGEAVRERVDMLKSELSRYFRIGDIITANVMNVTRSQIIQLSMRDFGLKKMTGGRVITVSPYKVPRIIGKNGSMISMIKQYTQCNLVVGQNGHIWLDGAPEKQILAEKTIKFIEENAHTSGLTDRVKELLEKGGFNEQA